MSSDPTIEFILKSYDLIKILGEEGKVFKVRNKKTNRIESLKLLKPDKTKMDNVVARFQREIDTVTSIKKHFPNILVPEIFFSQIHKGSLFYTMEYIEGHTLKKSMFSVEPKRAVKIVIAVLKILEKIHSKNILHRDIKPNNIMIDNNNQVWLLDFGITKQIEDDSPGLTRKGHIVGTPQYIAPEQAFGETLGSYSDIYSLGVIFYEMLTQKPMIKDKDIRDALLKKTPAPIEINKEIPEKLNIICLKAIQKNKKLRYQSATELCRDLEKYIVELVKEKWKKS